MQWEFDGEGQWEAFSLVGHDEMPFQWRIGVCDDGSFDVSESDPELTSRKETFPTLAEAKAFCEATDNSLAEF